MKLVEKHEVLCSNLIEGKKTVSGFFPFCSNLGGQSYVVPMLVESSKYPLESVEVYISWPGHKERRKRKSNSSYVDYVEGEE